MKPKLFVNKVIVKKSPIHGYGVFAAKNFALDEIIEECHTLLTDNHKDDFSNYYFAADTKNAIPLGFGCIYNHSDRPNATYYFDVENQLMIFKARRLIYKDEEICTSYGETWFAGRRVQKKELPFWKRYWRVFRGLPLRVCIAIGSFFYSRIFIQSCWIC